MGIFGRDLCLILHAIYSLTIINYISSSLDVLRGDPCEAELISCYVHREPDDPFTEFLIADVCVRILQHSASRT